MKKNIFIALLFIGGLTACSDNDEGSDIPDNPGYPVTHFSKIELKEVKEEPGAPAVTVTQTYDYSAGRLINFTSTQSFAHFDISRDKSLRAVEEAMKGDQKLFIVTQKDTEKEDPQGEDLYEVGLLAVVRQVVKLQKNIMRVLIEGIGRAEIYEYTQTADYMQARVIVYDQEDDEQLPEQAKSAMLLSVQETFAKYARVHGKIGQDVMRQVQEETDLLKLLDYVGNSLVISYKKKQKLLEAVTLTARYEAVLSSLLQETEILALKRDFQKKVQEHVDKNQKDYLLREQMQVIREELGESNTETEAIRN